jgi:hypothetical protein
VVSGSTALLSGRREYGLEGRAAGLEAGNPGKLAARLLI